MNMIVLTFSDLPEGERRREVPDLVSDIPVALSASRVRDGLHDETIATSGMPAPQHKTEHLCFVFNAMHC